MTRYHEFAQDWPPFLNTLTLREPVFYFVYPVVHALTGNGTVTFLVFDLLGGVIVMRAMQALDDDGSDYTLALAPTIISSYVFLLGQQNVLRQHLATIILLWSLAARARHRRSAFPLLVLSFLAHNMTAVTLGCWWDAGRTRHRYGPLITAAGVILIGLFLPVLGKSYLESTGMRTEYLYLLVAGILGLILLFSRRAPAARPPAVRAAQLHRVRARRRHPSFHALRTHGDDLPGADPGRAVRTVPFPANRLAARGAPGACAPVATPRFAGRAPRSMFDPVAPAPLVCRARGLCAPGNSHVSLSERTGYAPVGC